MVSDWETFYLSKVEFGVGLFFGPKRVYLFLHLILCYIPSHCRGMRVSVMGGGDLYNPATTVVSSVEVSEVHVQRSESL